MHKSITALERQDYIGKPLSDLPFTSRNENHSNWSLPAVNDYGEACSLGREYAAHFLQWMKVNNQHQGGNYLGLIVSGIDFTDESAAKGVHVDFFSALEQMLMPVADNVDFYQTVDNITQYYQDAMSETLL